MGKLKTLRTDKNLTQRQAADLVGISLRSYKSYENDVVKEGSLKYNYIFDEEHGIIDIKDIRQKCSEIFDKYRVNFCYLFGSYAKGKAREDSDVDLLISTDIKGLKFYGLVEDIRASLHKKVDALDVAQLKDNLELIEEVLKDGIKIYG